MRGQNNKRRRLQVFGISHKMVNPDIGIRHSVVETDIGIRHNEPQRAERRRVRHETPR
ncbi:MAG: hypothetical protein IJH04_09715 [Eggerthellaceae bacterium]|nr:hypothetical protein [Eggerthellaceae bacterium]